MLFDGLRLRPALFGISHGLLLRFAMAWACIRADGEREDWQSFYLFTVGGPIEDGRLTTLPAYSVGEAG
jgi:hypothetical protein